jgi:hypothetical protein
VPNSANQLLQNVGRALFTGTAQPQVLQDVLAEMQRNQASAITDTIIDSASKDAKTEIDDAKGLAGANLTQCNDQVAKIQKRVADVSAQLNKVGNGQQQTFYSVLWMMALLALMFLVSVMARLSASKRIGVANARAIIDDKTLIEFGGMSFILLTIIILGNTNKLQPESCGTLLGTIAGYIFGKGIAGIAQSDQKSTNRQAGSASRTPVVTSVTIDAARSVLRIIGSDISVPPTVEVTAGGASVPVGGIVPGGTYSVGADRFATALDVTLTAALNPAPVSVSVRVTNIGGFDKQWSGNL